MGKDYLTDVLESKRTLMVIHCLAAAEPADRDRLVEILRLGQDKDLEHAAEVVELLRRYDSIEFAREQARALIQQAREYLSAVRPSPARDVLESMASFFLEREK
jgi:geranylgeranyl pyrophosphate synthase